MTTGNQSAAVKSWCRRLFYSLLPVARRPVRIGAVAPLVLFFLAFVAITAGLSQAEIVSYSYYWPFALLVLAPWLWWQWWAGGAGLSGWRSYAALGIRYALFSLLVIVLTEPRSVRQDKRLSVVYVVDHSGSVSPEAFDAAAQFVKQVGPTDRRDETLAGVVYFGRDAAVQLPPRERVSAEQLQQIDVAIRNDGTNISEALSLSAAMLSETASSRIVLISDGTATEGELAPVLSELKSRDIAVDVLPIEYSYTEEVWLERLDLPRQVQQGQTYEAAVILSSLTSGHGKLVLMENDRTVLEQPVEYPAGKSRYVVPITLREPGYYEYTARIEPDGQDHIPQNNIAMDSLFLQGQGQILVVTDPAGDERDWQTLVQTLIQSEFSVKQVPAYDLPFSPLALMPYDGVIFLNVPSDAFEKDQILAMHDAIYHQGVGFLMVGGAQSFGPGGWRQTPIETALPVEMDITQRKVLLNGALVIVLDHSGSMGEQVPGTSVDKQTLANTSAAASINLLNPRDWLGVVAFDVAPTWVVPFALNADAARSTDAVRHIGTGGGTDMYPALEEALSELLTLKPGDAAVKHIVLLTDGQSYGSPVDFVQRCKSANISVSTIGVGDPQNVNGPLLAMMAHETGGRFHAVTDAQRLPRIMIREALTLRKSALRNTTFSPEAQMISPILKGIVEMPPLHGLVVTVPKDRAELVLSAPPEVANDVSDPLLALQRYGVGRTAAFTSDLSPNWGRDWLGWNRYQVFVKQLMTEVSRAEINRRLQVHSFANGTTGVIQVEDFGTEAELLELRATVQGPNSFRQQVVLSQQGPRRYEGQFPLPGEGRYHIVVTGAGTHQALDGFVVPYSQEYLRLTSSPLMLKRIAVETGGRILTGHETGDQIYVKSTVVKQQTQSIVTTLLQLLAMLVPLDVAMRRVQLDFGVITRWFRRKPAASATSLGTLLAQKQATVREQESRPIARPRLPSESPSRSDRPQRPSALAPTSSATDAAATPPTDAASPATNTISRLLDAKLRTWENQDNPPPQS
ncbi:VWA domain-containing protein [bacterium]|nr:VWA domain-containing protein [bacterium]